VFDLSHFYAIVADFHTRVQYLFSKPRYSVLMSSHLSRSSSAEEPTRQGVDLVIHFTISNYHLESLETRMRGRFADQERG
jgi:hypothetical protein